jgi:hypothetical protein
LIVTVPLGIDVNVGAVVSCTLTLNVFAAEVLPVASFAVQETVVFAIENVELEGGLHVVVGDGSIVSTAVALKMTTAPPGPVASRVMSAGTVRVGGVLSTRLTVTVDCADP